MRLIEEIGFILIFGIFIYAWNTFVIPRIIKSVVKMNKNNQWLSRNQATIIKCYQVFFWSALILYVLSGLYSKLFTWLSTNDAHIKPRRQFM